MSHARKSRGTNGTMKLSFSIAVGVFAVTAIISSGVILATPAYAQEKEDEAQETSGVMTKPQAEVSPVQAMAAAQRKVGGKAAIATFEFEEGHWSYGVIVAKNHKLMEVEIDAMTGKILDSEMVSPAEEAREFQRELTRLSK
jgi:uncharacterized membrane protein YkoI